MLLSLNWLREFVPYDGGVQELGDRLTMLGLELEEIIHPFADLDKVVVGFVAECDKHPEADKLSVCSVDVGTDENLSIVCGAPNVAKGQKVAVATVGAVLPGGLKIKKAKLRGVPSQGMICAEDELGLGQDHSGIMVLDESLTVGTDIREALNLDTTILDLGVTPNRADCFSVLGIAREVGLAFDLPVTIPTVEQQGFGVCTESGDDASNEIAIEIADPDLCPVFQGRVIDNVSVKRAPAKMRYRLAAIGQRPINALVDVTNYVMFGLGQPLHAYDMDLLQGGKIRVAPATDGMTFTTLDDQERKLLASDLLIWDGERPVGLAGVMGGQNTEVNDKTKRVFLEAAVFRPASIRKTARRLSLPSESSFRFERGVDQPGSLLAINMAAEMIANFSGGQLRPGMCVNEARSWTNKTFTFRPERARKLLGLPLEDDFCRKTVKGMGCEIEDKDGTWSVTAPSHRLDLEREVDIIEEVGRVWGLDRIPAELPYVKKPLEGIGGRESAYDFWMRVKHWGRGVGLSEAVNYSFVGQADLDRLNLPAEGRIPVKNPLSEDQDVLRTELAPGLLNNVRHNIAQGASCVRLFELAHIFEADSESDTTAREPGRLGIALYGHRHQGAWPWPEEDADYKDLKGLVEHLVAGLGLPMTLEYAMADEHPWLAPCVAVTLAGKPFGHMGRVKPEIADEYLAKQDVWMAELDLDLLADEHAANAVKFANLPKLPPSRRDMTIIAPATLPLGRIMDHIGSIKMPLLEDVSLIDVFVPEGKEGEEADERNLTLRFTFRHASRTLKDKEVDKEREKVANSLMKTLPVRV